MTDSVEALIKNRFGSEATSDMPTPNTTIASQLKHRTHRAFLDEPVAAATLQQIVAATFSAPSKSDLQQVSLIHIKAADKRTALAELIPAMPWIGTCPEFFIFCADGRRIQQVAKFRGKPFANDNLDNFIAAVCDVGIAIQAFISATDSLGLGCCPISVLRDHMDTVIEITRLPKRVIPIAGMCLGHPAREGFISMRLPLAATLHTDCYNDSNLEALINDYDRDRDSRFSLPTDRQKYPDRFGIADFYGWSEDKARQMATVERDNVGTCVRSRGFSLV
jgi:nitroreductase/FMN reductase [NAD(P)H]